MRKPADVTGGNSIAVYSQSESVSAVIFVSRGFAHTRGIDPHA
jgi:hypothetical protein